SGPSHRPMSGRPPASQPAVRRHRSRGGLREGSMTGPGASPSPCEAIALAATENAAPLFGATGGLPTSALEPVAIALRAASGFGPSLSPLAPPWKGGEKICDLLRGGKGPRSPS